MLITNDYVRTWVEKIAQICRPDSIYWCDGSEEEEKRLTQVAVAEGILTPLNPTHYPNSYAFHNYPNDTNLHVITNYFCTESEEDASDALAWRNSTDMLQEVETLITGQLEGKVMYVIPYLMGPPRSPFAKSGIQLTDSLQVVLHVRKLSRMGDVAWKAIGEHNDFLRGVHVTGNLALDQRMVVHFPELNACYTLNTDYGGYAYQCKGSFAMVMGSAQAVQESWLAEHMMILGIENPSGEIHYIAGAFPGYCGKSNLAFLSPPLYAKGYRCFTVSDDSAWLHVGPDGRLWAINPDAGFYSVLSGTNKRTSPYAEKAIYEEVIFSNVAVDSDGHPWWQGKEEEIPETLTDWQGLPWNKNTNPESPFNNNGRFCVDADKFPSMSSHWNETTGIPISAIIFGGRSKQLDPLVREARTYEEGLFYGVSLFADREDRIDRNPFGMMDFLGSSLSRYLQNWLNIGGQLKEKPKMFRVNWFRQDNEGSYIWPGYRENFRVMEWILKRLENDAQVVDTPIGYIPDTSAINLEGIPVTEATMRNALLTVDKEDWQQETKAIRSFLEQFKNIPEEIYHALEQQEKSLS